MNDVIKVILDEIKQDTIKGRFVGQWYVEGNERDKSKLLKLLNAKLHDVKHALTCFHVRRYPTEVGIFHIGQKCRESNKLFSLRVEIGQTEKPRFGQLPKRKR